MSAWAVPAKAARTVASPAAKMNLVIEVSPNAPESLGSTMGSGISSGNKLRVDLTTRSSYTMKMIDTFAMSE